MGRMAAALVVVLAMACGGDDGGGGDADAAATTTAVSPAEGSTTTVVPVALPGVLEAGTYRSAAFEPPLELTVEDDRWRLQVDQADVFSLVQADEGDSSVALVRPTGVFPPGGGAQEAVPDDLLSWVGDHPELGAGGAVTEIAVGDDTAACRGFSIQGPELIELLAVSDGLVAIDPGAIGLVCVVDQDLDPPLAVVIDAPSPTAEAHLGAASELLGSVRVTVG